MNELELLVAKKLLQLKCFSVQSKSPFIWANGWKSPIYFDDRKVFSYPYIRSFIKLELARMVAELFPDADVVAGIAVNAIGHGALVADQLALPYVYVLPTPKDHGLENQIEGDLRPRQKVVVIENQVSIGHYAMSVVEALRNSGCSVEGVVTIFDYQLPNATKLFKEADVPLVSLTNYEAVVQQARAEGIGKEEDWKALDDWRKNPARWKKSSKS